MARCAHSECGRWRPDIVIGVGGLGLRLDDKWYCSATCLQKAARERLALTPIAPPITMAGESKPPLGRLLTRSRKLGKDALDQAIRAQAQTGLRLGEQLVQDGLVSRHEVQRALAAQSGLAFLSSIDAARLAAAPGNLSLDAIRRLGLVPFDADDEGEVLRVACTAPVPRVAIGILRQLTGWIIEPYLVADDQWPHLLRAYGVTSRQGRPVCATLRDIEAAAARVVEAAKTGGARMSEARGDDYLWVRLQWNGTGRIEDLWLATESGSEMSAKRPNAWTTAVVADLAAQTEGDSDAAAPGDVAESVAEPAATIPVFDIQLPVAHTLSPAVAAAPTRESEPTAQAIDVRSDAQARRDAELAASNIAAAVVRNAKLDSLPPRPKAPSRRRTASARPAAPSRKTSKRTAAPVPVTARASKTRRANGSAPTLTAAPKKRETRKSELTVSRPSSSIAFEMADDSIDLTGLDAWDLPRALGVGR